MEAIIQNTARYVRRVKQHMGTQRLIMQRKQYVRADDKTIQQTLDAAFEKAIREGDKALTDAWEEEQTRHLEKLYGIDFDLKPTEWWTQRESLAEQYFDMAKTEARRLGKIGTEVVIKVVVENLAAASERISYKLISDQSSSASPQLRDADELINIHKEGIHDTISKVTTSIECTFATKRRDLYRLVERALRNNGLDEIDVDSYDALTDDEKAELDSKGHSALAEITQGYANTFLNPGPSQFSNNLANSFKPAREFVVTMKDHLSASYCKAVEGTVSVQKMEADFVELGKCVATWEKLLKWLR